MQNKSVMLKISILVCGFLFMGINTFGQNSEDFRKEQKEINSELNGEIQLMPGLRKNNDQVNKQDQIVKPNLEQKMEIDITQSSNQVNSGIGLRKCTPKNSINPFAISRQNFLKLPLDRQQFIIDNSHRYTIVD